MSATTTPPLALEGGPNRATSKSSPEDDDLSSPLSSSNSVHSPPSRPHPNNNEASLSHNSKSEINFGVEKVVKTTTSVKEKKVTSRKKENKEHNTNGNPSVKAVKKPRTSSGANTSRKKQKISDDSSKSAQGLPRQSKFAEQGDSHLSTYHPTPEAVSQIPNLNNAAHPTAQQRSNLAFVGAGEPTRSAGQHYDPIRSANIDAPLHSQQNVSQVSATPPRVANRASASPSIASLIDPPSVAPSVSSVPFSSARRPQPREIPKSAQMSPQGLQGHHTSNSVTVEIATPPNHPGDDMDLDANRTSVAKSASTTAVKKTNAGTSTGASSTAQSPKPIRQKEAPPPLPQGNGLLSSSLFGGAASITADAPEKSAPTVVLHIPMKGETNKYVNFARMAEERYGFNALHPRLAAQRERLARVAAAGAALEKTSGSGSADDMSLDLSEPESNVEMGGIDGGSEPGEKKPKRRTKADQYDKEDPFVDDSEMLWEEQAAASKDGFFVYSGPLVPEGEKPSIERADGTVKRGRGRGRGGSTRGSGSGRGGAAAGNSTSTRGSTTIRKPRVTKAARALLEEEKRQREQSASLAPKPSTYPG
ncbi:MAG: hypothetical protein M1836_000272 [Candelina mexicana]|nr:MAG: hypothetical protein M1836_000272 [Candelina mexicana]